MATKAQRYRSEEEREARKTKAKKTSTRKPKKAAWSHDKAHAASKATHALETVAPGKRPSRESTRGSANRAKADSALNVTEGVRKGAPSARARKSRARTTKVRGAGKGA